MNAEEEARGRAQEQVLVEVNLVRVAECYPDEVYPCIAELGRLAKGQVEVS